MSKREFNDEDYRKGLEKFLESLKIRDYIEREFLETELTQLIQDHYDRDFISIYSVRDTNYFGHVLTALRKDSNTRILIEESDRRLGKGLRLLQSYYGSKHLPSRKLKANPRSKKKTDIPKETDAGDNPDYPLNHSEGARKEMEMERAYRNREARNECIRAWGAQCQVCGLKFAKLYGEELGQGFIEVHHLIPISSRRGEYKIDPITELVPLCSNCHSMIHRGKTQPMTLAELRTRYKGDVAPIEKFRPS